MIECLANSSVQGRTLSEIDLNPEIYIGRNRRRRGQQLYEGFLKIAVVLVNRGTVRGERRFM